ncbi:Uncharacterised protein [Mycobacteroides abscessus subsp. abscessus]|nr:Uncharacterised protein [Mycobacteroides abscessus subsp. abscessus]
MRCATSNFAPPARSGSGTASPSIASCGWLTHERSSPKDAPGGTVGRPTKHWPQSAASIPASCNEQAASSKRSDAPPRSCAAANAPRKNGWRLGVWVIARAAGPRCGPCTRRSRLWITPATKTACGSLFRRFCRPIPVGGLYLLILFLLVLYHLPKTIHRMVRAKARQPNAALRATLRTQEELGDPNSAQLTRVAGYWPSGGLLPVKHRHGQGVSPPGAGQRF